MSFPNGTSEYRAARNALLASEIALRRQASDLCLSMAHAGLTTVRETLRHRARLDASIVAEFVVRMDDTGVGEGWEAGASGLGCAGRGDARGNDL